MADARRLGAAMVLAAACVLSGCGGPPSKAEYVTKMVDSIGDVSSDLSAEGIDPKAAEELVEQLLECQYDAIADDTELLSKVYDNPGDATVTAELDTKSQPCVDEFSQAMTAAAGG